MTLRIKFEIPEFELSISRDEAVELRDLLTAAIGITSPVEVRLPFPTTSPAYMPASNCSDLKDPPSNSAAWKGSNTQTDDEVPF